jgi:hypothetical protein
LHCCKQKREHIFVGQSLLYWLKSILLSLHMSRCKLSFVEYSMPVRSSYVREYRSCILVDAAHDLDLMTAFPGRLMIDTDLVGSEPAVLGDCQHIHDTAL